MSTQSAGAATDTVHYCNHRDPLTHICRVTLLAGSRDVITMLCQLTSTCKCDSIVICLDIRKQAAGRPPLYLHVIALCKAVLRCHFCTSE